MNKDLCWVKTILTVYRYLERICGAIDKIIMKSAMGSSNIVGQNYFYNNVFTISQKIIDLSERKVTLINLKLLIENSLSQIDEKDAQLLIEKYVDGLKNKNMADNLNVGLRTIFRRIDSAEMSLKSKLSAKGYNDEKLKCMLKNEAWIINTYNIIASKNEDVELSNAYLDKAVMM